MTFPLDQWFDITQKIPRDDLEEAECQIMLYAYKDGLDPNGKESKDACKSMRDAVKKHNKNFMKDK